MMTHQGNGHRSKYIGAKTGNGLKFCRKCRKQGAIIDTRQAANGHVTRRYRCVCGLRWTTVEHYLGATRKGRRVNAERFFMDKLRNEAKEELRADLKAVLGLTLAK